jgi:hypothetical protein
VEHEKVIAFRIQIEDEMKEIRLTIGNVGSFTIQSQRDNLVKRIRDLERRLKDQRQEHQRRLGRNDKRLGRRLTEEGRERYDDRSTLYRQLIKVINTYLTKVGYLLLSARNQFEKYEVEDENSSS